MNMNKALQHLYKAISGNDTSKVNISKLLCDIHYAATGVECAVKNNWARIIDSLATNWTGGGGGSSDFSTATVSVIGGDVGIGGATIEDDTSTAYLSLGNGDSGIVILYQGHATVEIQAEGTISTSGDIEHIRYSMYDITGDCTITIS